MAEPPSPRSAGPLSSRSSRSRLHAQLAHSARGVRVVEGGGEAGAGPRPKAQGPVAAFLPVYFSTCA